MKSIQIKDSYKIWSPNKMLLKILDAYWEKLGGAAPTMTVKKWLNRSYVSMYIEWWLHNIGYYLTRNIAIFDVINLRCKDVDLEEWQ